VTTAFENMTKLPLSCLSIDDTNGTLIRIGRGQKGFCLERDAKTNEPVTGDRAVQLRDEYNKKFGITKAQEKAMVNGSMFGFHCPAADPENPMNQEG